MGQRGNKQMMAGNKVSEGSRKDREKKADRNSDCTHRKVLYMM